MKQTRPWSITPGLAGALALLAAAAPGAAQQFTGTLTLEEAVQIAREHNPTFQRVRNDAESAAAAVRAAWAAAFLPGIGTNMGFNGSHSTRVTGEDAYGTPVRLPESRTTRSSSASQGVSMQLTLFDGLGSWRGWKAQGALQEGTAAQIAAQELQLVAQVSREYYEAVRTSRLIRLEEQLLESARDQLQRTEELLRLAAKNRVDVLGARGDVARTELSLERARGDAHKARLSLATTLGIDPTSSITLDTVVPAISDPADLDADVLVTRALASSPLLRQRASALEAARHRSAAARGRRLPTVSASGGYGRSVQQRGYGAFGEVNPLNYGFNFGMSIQMPVFTRFATSVQITDAAAAVHDAEQDLRGARLTVERDVRAALIDLVNAYRSLMLAELQAELGRERQDLTQEQYRMGAVTFTELQAVIERTAEAERRALDARFQFINARLSLEEKLGSRLEG